MSLTALTHGAPVAAVLLLVIVLLSLAGLFVAPSIIERGLFRPFWLLPRREYLTLLISGFIHADLAHLFFNAFTFWAFAFGLEREIGSARFLALYVFGLLISDAGTWWQHHREPGYQTLGASGAILAVLFASIIYFPTSSLYLILLPVPIPAPLFALGYLAYTWYASRRSLGRVNHDAHLAGALGGIAFVALTDAPALARAWEAVRRLIA
jgi:membrane associated rhomboid family serine protease